MFNQIGRKFYSPSPADLNPVSMAVGATTAGMQSLLGLTQVISGDTRVKRLMGQRKAFKTPEEVFKVLNATQNMAQQGYDATTLNFLTSDIDRSFAEGLGAAQRMGADPNQLSS